jgi:hypothetical protein
MKTTTSIAQNLKMKTLTLQLKFRALHGKFSFSNARACFKARDGTRRRRCSTLVCVVRRHWFNASDRCHGCTGLLGIWRAHWAVRDHNIRP